MSDPTGKLSFGDAAARIATGRIAGAFATTTALKALPPKARQDGMIGLVMAGLELYAFDADSASPSGLTPDAGSGRWMPVGAGGGGASDATSPLHLVRAASTGALAAATYDATTKTLTADANGALNPVDGVTLAVGDRFFYKDHGTATRRGIYVITSIGGGGSKWSMERASDFDESADLSSGALIVVSEGTANADKIWMLSVNEAIVLDTTSLTFTKLPNLADLASTANALGASLIGIEDAATLYAATDVEAALAEVKALADAAIALSKRELRIQHSDLTEAVNGNAQAINLGAALPANAVVLASQVKVDTLFSGGGATAVKLDIGGTDIDAIAAQHDVFTGAATGALAPNPAGVHPQGKFSAEQLVATFTPDGAHALLGLDAGDLTITVWYSVLA